MKAYLNHIRSQTFIRQTVSERWRKVLFFSFVSCYTETLWNFLAIITNLRDEVKTIKKELETKEEYIADLRYKIIKNYNSIQITSFKKSFGGCWS